MSMIPDAPVTRSVTNPAETHDTARRLQVGIGGVLAVLLLVGLAGLISDRARQEALAEAASSTAGAPAAPAEKAGEPGAEPLAELGVQPSATKEAVAADKVAPVAPVVPAPASGTAKVPDLQPDPALQRAQDAAR